MLEHYFVKPSTIDKIRGSWLGSHIESYVQNTVTAYLLQQIQLLAHRGRRGLPPWSAAGNRSAKPTF